MSAPATNQNSVSFEGDASIPEISRFGDDDVGTYSSNTITELPPRPPTINRSQTSDQSNEVPPSMRSQGKSTMNTSIFVPPSSTRYLAAPRIPYDTTTKCIIPKELRLTNQSDLRKLRDTAVLPLENQIGLIPLDDSE